MIKEKRSAGSLKRLIREKEMRGLLREGKNHKVSAKSRRYPRKREKDKFSSIGMRSTIEV